jgi:AraC-like DNA-binding protein
MSHLASRDPLVSQTGAPQDTEHGARAVCIDQADVFQHPLLENPPASSAPAGVRRSYSGLAHRAAQSCRRCPLLAGCLYDAVVRHDVAGYAAGTTARERNKVRSLLGITVEPESLDTLAGVSGGNRPVDHDEVVRLRAANPDESLERLAQRLGCSLSTVKRHLRQERSGGGTTRRQPRPLPSMAAVLATARRVLDAERSRGSAAA